MDNYLRSTVTRAVEKGDLPDSSVDTEDTEGNEGDIEHEQIYYLLADAYPDQFDDVQDAKESIHEALGIEGEEKEDPCWEGYEQVGMKEGEDGEMVPDCVPKNQETKGIDEEEATEENEDFNPADTPDNLDQHPHDEPEWQEDYDREREEKGLVTDQYGRVLSKEV